MFVDRDIYFSDFVGVSTLFFYFFYSDSFHFKYLCLVNGSADSVFSYKYTGLWISLDVQTVASQCNLFICESSRSCCNDRENKGVYFSDKKDSPCFHSHSISLWISLISLGWKDLFLSCRKLFLCSHKIHATFQILLWVLDKRSCEDCRLLMFERCFFWHVSNLRDQNRPGIEVVRYVFVHIALVEGLDWMVCRLVVDWFSIVVDDWW